MRTFSAAQVIALQDKENSHPFWHVCRKCWTFGKFVFISLLVNAIWDFATFQPIHRFYEMMGWIK